MTIVAIALAFVATSCSKDDDENNEPEYAIGSAEELQGVWSGYTTNKDKAVVMGFGNDGKGLLQKYNYSNSVGDYVGETSDFINFNYSYYPYGGKVYINYTSILSGNATWRVESMTSEFMSIQIDGVTYYCEKYHDNSGNGGGNSGGGGSTNGYAPSDVSDMHIHIGLHSYSLDLYFNSNYSVDMKYSKMNTPFTLISASYSKTGANAATVSYTWSSSTGTHDGSVTLSFTSAGGGTADEYPYSGSFTIEDFSRSSSAEAPANIAYKTLHVPYGTDTWYKFGEQTSNYVSITSYSDIITYEKIYATYTKTSATTATITIYVNISSYTSTKQKKYTLDFHTSTSGKYTFYSNNGSFGSSSWTGDFTLQ